MEKKIYGFTLKRVCDLEVGDKVAVYREGLKASIADEIHPEPIKFEEVYKIKDGMPYFRPYSLVRVGRLLDRDEVLVLVELKMKTTVSKKNLNKNNS